MGFLSKIFGSTNERYLKKFFPIIEKINSLEKEFEEIPTDKLKDKTAEFVERIAKGEKSENLLPEAFALVREAAKRTIKQRHFDVQLLGGIILFQGNITEMRTGEGKTLVATLPLYLAALEKKGAHLVTVNDYLARRDAEWMGKIYHLLGLSTGVLNHEKAYLYQPKPEARESHLGSGEELEEGSRREAYQADITYATNNELGFDFLRDNLAYRLNDTAQTSVDSHSNQREFALNYAIVDEVDSILIDEARTPLIISAPAEESAKLYFQLAEVVERLKPDTDYKIDEKMKAVTLTEEGQEKIIQLLHQDPWEMSASFDDLEKRSVGIKLDHHITAALRAKALFKKDKDYVVKDGEIIIVDEFTGRLMHGRRYSEGLHQALEAKEKVEVKKESKTLATITFQNYFKIYKKLAGMTGTAITEAEEFYKIYKLDVIEIPTNKPMIRKDLPDRIYGTEINKFKAVAREAKERFKTGQPVLIGTASIEKNELMSKLLEKVGVPHEMLNAKNHEREAQVLSRAGEFKAVTVATNMAGRGVDIILGGSPPINVKTDDQEFKKWQEEHNKILEIGGLHVIGTERHESRRIDNQLRGRAGRQGDPGSSQFFVSTEDDLMRIFGGNRIKSIMQTFRFPEDMPIENKILSNSIEKAQRKVEGENFDIRKHLLDYDNVLAKHRDAIYRLRGDILEKEKSEEARSLIVKMIEQEIERIIAFYTVHDAEQKWDLKKIGEICASVFNLPDNWYQDFEKIRSGAGTREQDVYARNDLFEYLLKMAQESLTQLEEKNEQNLFYQAVKFLMLRTIDQFWIWHLESMENLKGGIGLRAYGQRDPLVEYKKEAYGKYHRLIEEIRTSTIHSIFKVSIQKPSFSVESADSEGKGKSTKVGLPTEAIGRSTKVGSPPSSASWRTSADARFSNPAVAGRKLTKVGRNDPCPCGSGKKYKKCCGK